jgi:23S rRNA pseudouridine1911/1915/1917 synthase
MLVDQEEFRIIGETPDLLVVDKPAGLLVHPSKPDGTRTLWDGLRELLCYEIANSGQVSLINRLDRETSGLVLVAKHAAAARRAAIAMQEGKIKKTYLSILCGHPKEKCFSIDAPITRQGEVEPTKIHLKRMVHPAGAHAKTHFRDLKKIENTAGRFSMVEAQPVTGRTHQIRVHASHAGHPVVGDKIYGPSEDCYLEFIQTGWTLALQKRLFLKRHALQSAGLKIEWNGVPMEWKTGWAEDLKKFAGNVDNNSEECLFCLI